MSRNNTNISYNELRELGYYVPEEAARTNFTVWSDGEVAGYVDQYVGHFCTQLEEQDMHYLNQVWELEFFDI